MSSVSGNASYLYLTFMIHEALSFWEQGRTGGKILEPDIAMWKMIIFYLSVMETESFSIISEKTPYICMHT